MKKLLSILVGISLVVPTTLLVVSCGHKIINLKSLKTNIGGIDGLDKKYIIGGIKKANPNYTFNQDDLIINFDSFKHETDTICSIEVDGQNMFASSFTVEFTLNSADLNALEAKIEEAAKLVESNTYSTMINSAKFTLYQEIGYGKGIVKTKPLAHKQDEIGDAIAKLDAAIFDFTRADREVVDVFMLGANINSYGKVKTDRKDPKDPAIEAMKQAFEEAKNIYQKAKSWDNSKEHRNAVDKAAEHLWSTIFGVIMLPNVDNQRPNVENGNLTRSNLNDRMLGDVLEQNQDSQQLAPRANDIELNANKLDAVDNPKLDTFENLIQQANKIEQKDKGFVQYAELKKAIGLAEGIDSVYENEIENEGVLSKAIDDLQKAINDFNDPIKNPDLKAVKASKKLNALLAEANQVSSSKHFKPEQVTNNLTDAIIKANDVGIADLGISREKEVYQAINKLQLAILEFYQADNKFVDYSRLDTTLATAKGLLFGDKNNKLHAVVDHLEREIKKAEHIREQNLLADQEAQVTQVTKTLSEAYEAFIKSESNKVDIKKVITTTNLGRVKNNQEETIRRIVIKENPEIKLQGLDIEIINETSAKIKGNYDYVGEVIVNYTIIPSVAKVETPIVKILNTKMTDLWKQSDLQKAINQANLDVEGGITVEEDKTLNESYIQRWKVTGNGSDDNTFKYASEIDLYFIKNRDTNSNTIYLDGNNKIQVTSTWAPEGTKEIINIGWNGNGWRNTLPDSVEKVPNYISPKIISLSQALAYKPKFNSDISNWDTSNVVNMEALFMGATSFNQDISKWNTSKVTTVEGMFWSARAFNQDLSKWDVSNVTNTNLYDNMADVWNKDFRPKFNK
ncbi:hypothetical protein ELUMI_v1c00710 [Williamsoniiplasma luminosum]|uniref:BspA family leucine-rich repeat surface protein n=1 Tax=Williamsoniiplasma luminosum TaxID=214888 RepID=A0A2K8NSM5_9MOLU|nr:BspA family leucine-rich repeat surface protein [Williamsoniiplasma luminosum]ATZ16799.1 hypothetical protein ELUMI_v1c00710 [Williamsoniiplasma luminosum]